MRIAFISTRGIPNDYGGFEQFAEYISVGLANRGHEVTVYSPHFHPYKENSYKGVRIKHIYSPETWMGSSVGSFFYDFASLRDALKRERFDIIYEAGYTSIVPAYIWFNVNPIFFQRFCASNHSKYFSCSSTKCSHEYAVRISSKFAAINFSLSRTTYAAISFNNPVTSAGVL